MTVTTSHKYIPFSTSFLPSMQLQVICLGDLISADLKVQNLKTKKWDLGNGCLFLHNPAFESKFGCSVQIVNSTAMTHSNLLQELEAKEIKDLAREVVRSSVYRVEKSYSLIRSDFTTVSKQKKVNGVKCTEHFLSFVYRSQDVESSLSSDGIKYNTKILSGKQG